MKRLLKASKLEYTAELDKSVIFNEKESIELPIYALNIAFSGRLKVGFISGCSMFAGPSKHFKSMYALLCAKAYMDKYKDAVLYFWDNEFGTPRGYFNALGLDTKRIIHAPLVSIEELTIDAQNVLSALKRGDKAIFIVDSIGNIASTKEIQDAQDSKEKADMGLRAKKLKSLFRIVTPQLNLKDLNMIIVNHSYDTMEMFSKTVVSGGSGSVYSANNIFIIGKQQDKDAAKKLLGYNFVINVNKSRFCVEGEKLIIKVSKTKGISRYTGLMEIAEELGFVIKPNNRSYQRVFGGVAEERKWSKAESDTKDFWQDLIDDEAFNDAIEKKYYVSNNAIVKDENDALPDPEEEGVEDLEGVEEYE